MRIVSIAIAAGGPAHLRNVGDMSRSSADSVIAFALGGRDESAAPSPVTSVPRGAAGAASAPASNAELPEAVGKPLVVRVCGKMPWRGHVRPEPDEPPGIEG